MDDPDWLPPEDFDDVTTEKVDRRSRTRGDMISPAGPKRLPNSSTVGRSPLKQQTDQKAAQTQTMFKEQQPDNIAEPPLRIAAFNIQIFGATKMRKKSVVDILVKIIQRYDLILIQEIRDRSRTALDSLIKIASRVDPSDPFISAVSERLGRGHSKEQYAFLYRPSRLAVTDVYQYDDGEDNGTDVFQREPFAVRLHSSLTEVQDFAIIAIHTAPEDAVKEVGALHKVYDVTKRHWGLEDIIIAGDFNADEGYVDREDWVNIKLKNDKRFKWLIGDTVDTTVGNTDRAYDRFVIAGSKLTHAVVPGSVNVFKFDKEFNLSVEEVNLSNWIGLQEAEDVSDHYPIEMQLMGKADHEVQRNLNTRVSVTVNQRRLVADVTALHKMFTSRGRNAAFFTTTVTYDQSSRASELCAVRDDVEDVIQCLRDFQSAFPQVVLNETVRVVKAFLDSDILNPHNLYVYGLLGHERVDKYDIAVTIKLQDPPSCCIMISRSLS